MERKRFTRWRPISDKELDALAKEKEKLGVNPYRDWMRDCTRYARTWEVRERIEEKS